MNDTANKSRLGAWLQGLLIAAALFALYFAGMGSYPLLDPDEPVYGQVAKEMAAGAGWLTPHYGGHEWFDKSPLFYWLSGASAKVLGATELAVRLPSAILAVGLVFLVYLLASFDFGRRAGIFSAIVIATCLQQIVLARASVTDMTLVFCLMAAIYAYRRWLAREGEAPSEPGCAIGQNRLGRSLALPWLVLCGVMTGLAMLAKGPVAPLLLFGTFFIHLWWTGKLRRLVSLDAAAGIAAFLIIGLPWYAAMYLLHGDAFVQGFLVANNIVRFLKPEHAGVTGHWYSYFMNIPVLLVMFFPWSPFLPQAFIRGWRGNDGARLAIVWIAVVFAFFSISKTQLVTYIFPLYPAAAVLIGNLWDSAASGEPETQRGPRLALLAALGISILIFVALVGFSRAKYPEAERTAVILGGILLLTLVSAVWARRRDASRAVWFIGAGMAVWTLWLVFSVMPFVGPRASTHDLVKEIPSQATARVATYRRVDGRYVIQPQGLLFYLNQEPQDLPNAAAAADWLSNSNPSFIICREADANKIAPPGSIRWAKSGKMVILANTAARRND